MPTQPHTPSDHYRDAERLLAAAESSVTEQLQNTSALLALAHAVLTLSPRRARRVERPGRHANGGLPRNMEWGDE